MGIEATSWVDTVSAISAASSAAFVVVGGLWAFFRFRKEAPYIARANLTLEAELLVHDGNDLISITVSASAVGQGHIVFEKVQEPPNVTVFAMTQAQLVDPPPEWRGFCAVTELFAHDTEVAAGEAIEEVDLLWVGPRAPGTVAYRVEARFEGSDTAHGTPYWWVAVAVVTVEATPHHPTPAAPVAAS